MNPPTWPGNRLVGVVEWPSRRAVGAHDGAAAEATDFVLELDGSCGYNFARDELSFQDIEYPDWDVSFCHEFSLSLFARRFPGRNLRPGPDVRLRPLYGWRGPNLAVFVTVRCPRSDGEGAPGESTPAA